MLDPVSATAKQVECLALAGERRPERADKLVVPRVASVDLHVKGGACFVNRAEGRDTHALLGGELNRLCLDTDIVQTVGDLPLGRVARRSAE